MDKGLVLDRDKAATYDVARFVDYDYGGYLNKGRSIFGYIFTFAVLSTTEAALLLLLKA